MYNLVKETLVQRLETGMKWISSIDLHPGGNHLLVGSHDNRVAWFDTELDTKPFKTLRYHSKAVRRGS